jgi:hypothetical protein
MAALYCYPWGVRWILQYGRGSIQDMLPECEDGKMGIQEDGRNRGRIGGMDAVDRVDCTY